MKSKILLLAVVLTILILFLSPAYALNCNRYRGEQKTLCKTINSLPLTDSYKRQLLQRDLYNTDVVISNEPIVLNINSEGQEPISFNQVYDDKIITIGKFLSFIFLNYSILSILTKSFNILKWLSVVS